MNKQLLFRLALDFVMTALMLTAFAYQLTGNLTHEVIGVTVFFLFITHNAINRQWYKNLFRGIYGMRRTLGTTVNLLLLIIMMLLAFSGVMISRDIFSFLHLGGGFAMRQLHTLASYWGLVLISIHTGLHWDMVLGAMRKLSGVAGANRIREAALRVITILITAYGVKSSFDMSIGSKLFLRYTFGYWDFENNSAGFFLACLSIMGLYIFITYHVLDFLSKRTTTKKDSTTS